MKEHCVRYIALPYSIPGMTVEDDGGYYNIYINSLLAESEQRCALIHELRHVLRGDFDADKPLSEVESYRPPVGQEPIRFVATKAIPAPSPLPHFVVAENNPRERKTEITTVGQLLKFMVELEGKRQSSPQRKSCAAGGSIDIWADEMDRK